MTEEESARIVECIQQCGKDLGFPSEQLQIVKAFVGGRDVFVSLPTGAGKSLCFAILPLVFDVLHQQSGSIAVIVSPLIALMQDQVSIAYLLPTQLCAACRFPHFLLRACLLCKLALLMKNLPRLNVAWSVGATS